jgi:thiol-disulfide isomerase/thioredoxin
MLYAQLIVYNKYSWLFSENPTHFRRGLLLSALVILLALLNNQVQAEQPSLKPFTTGSYQQILANNANQPFMLVVWSITCSSCLKDMPLLSRIHKKQPELKIIMLAADDISETDQIQAILKKTNYPTLKTGGMLTKTRRNCNFRLTQNGMVNYQELIFSIRHISAKVLAVYYQKPIMTPG